MVDGDGDRFWVCSKDCYISFDYTVLKTIHILIKNNVVNDNFLVLAPLI